MENSYRSDINGLRGIAVLAVIFYHFFPSLFNGGYLGVDIFFVISGYLITKIIIIDMNNDNFKLSDFFKKRIRRIFPALFIVIITFFFVAQLSLFNDELIKYYRHAIASSFFLTNFLLIKEISYFDQEAFTKPLLNLWSLGVEEQFYIFFPIALIILHKLKFNYKYFLVTLTLASISLAFYLHNNNQSIGFYFPLSRFWEIFYGSLLAIYVIENKNKLISNKRFEFISIIGVILLLFGVIFFEETATINLIFFQLVIVIATGFILILNNENLISKVVLTNKYIGYIGLISYPLYLWHWPIFSFYKIFFIELREEVLLILLILTFILSSLTYHIVEKKIRSINSNKIYYLLLLPFLVTSMAFLFKNISNDRYIDDLLEKEVLVDWTYNEQNKGCLKNYEHLENKLGVCSHDPNGLNEYFLFGDSKAISLHKGLLETTIDNKSWVIAAGSSGVPNFGSPSPFLSDHPKFYNYQNLLNAVLDSISENDSIKIVAIIPTLRVMVDDVNEKTWRNAQFSNYHEGYLALNNSIKKLAEHNKKVLLIADNPPLNNFYQCNDRKIKIPFINKVIKINKISDTGCSITADEYNTYTKKYFDLLSNLKNNYAMIYDGNKWNLKDRDEVINNILDEKEVIVEQKLEEWIENGKNYPDIMKKFNRYLEKKENDTVLNKVKNEIKLMLFNNREMILKN